MVTKRVSRAGRWTAAVAVASLLTGVTGSTGITSAGAAPGDANAGSDQMVSVIVALDPSESDLAPSASKAAKIDAVADDVVDALGDDIEDITRYERIPAVALEIERSGLEALRSQPGVISVAPDRQMSPLLAESTAAIGAPSAWASGLDGSNQVIAIVDTGVQASHPAFSGKVLAEACFAVSGCPGGTGEGSGKGAPCTDLQLSDGDQCDHGTGVAATAAANGGGLAGTAIDADLLTANVFRSVDVDPDLYSTAWRVLTDESALLSALDWVLDKRLAGVPVAAVNLSLGSDAVHGSPCNVSGPMSSIVASLTNAGVAVVAASGNGDENDNGYTSGISYPACVQGVVSVGAVNAVNQVSSFSNASSGLSLYAPGEQILTARPTNLTTTMLGTSLAAPHVAGAFAILREQQPSASVSTLAKLLDRTGDQVVDTRFEPDKPSTAPLIRLDRAIDPQYQAANPAALTQATSPFGSLDVVARAAGGIRVAGWALDADGVTPVDIHVYVDGVLANFGGAGNSRADIGAAFPGYGNGHGYDLVVPASDGNHTVCVYAINLGAGTNNTQLGCRGIATGAVTGSLDVVQGGLGVVRVAGWTLDTGTAASTEVHVYADGNLVAGGIANVPRGDIAAAFPGYGPNHGYDFLVPMSGGPHTICVYAIEVGAAINNPQLGCRGVVVPGGAPFGSIDTAVGQYGGIRVSGWTIDPDTSASLDAHVYVDGALASGTVAAGARSDVGGAFPGYGNAHGYDVSVAAPAGNHQVCVYALNKGFGSNTQLGCRTVTVPSSAPFGSLDVAKRIDGGIEVGGWAIDPDHPTTPLEIHIYADGAVVTGAGANVNRPDIGSAFPTAGPFHGYSRAFAAGGGAKNVCAYAINIGAGTNALLGCRVVQ